LAALSAFQAHLDAWQGELARERESLRAERESLLRDGSTAGEDQANLSELGNELNATRDKVNALTTMLLSRTEELRVLDNRRAELVTELELSRAREKELKVSLDDIRQQRDAERIQWGEETRRLRELLERRLESAPATSSPEQAGGNEPPAVQHRVSERPVERLAERTPEDNPVFASVMEQFGKLRQQKARAGSALKKGR
jgi:chromosome segregation ATPase